MNQHKPQPGLRGFQDALIAACGRFEVACPPADTGQVTRGHLGGLDCVSVLTPAGAIIRDMAAIRRDPGRHLFLIRQHSGTARMQQDGQSAHLGPGDFFVVDAARPSVFGYDSPSQQFSLHLPADLARGTGLAGGVIVRGAAAMGHALACASARLTRDGPDRLLALLAMTARDRTLPEADLATAALALIGRFSRDPDMTPARLARDLGVHLRQLQRALAGMGQTASAAIETARMADARTLLRKHPDMTVAAVSAMAGFPDISRFTRGFRTRHGQTPTAWRVA